MDSKKPLMTSPMLVHVRRARDRPGLWIVVEVVDNTDAEQRAAFTWPKTWSVATDEDIKQFREIGCKFLVVD